MDSLVDAWFFHIDGLEAANHTHAAGEILIIFGVGGGTYHPDSVVVEVRFQQVRHIAATLCTFSCPYDVVNLVEIDDAVCLTCHTLHNLLQSLLHVATEASASQQRAHVELVDVAPFQSVGYFTFLNTARHAIYQRSFTYARLADV